MRGVIVAALVAVAPGLAASDPRPADKPIDGSTMLDKLTVFRDDLGNFYVVPRAGAFANLDDANAWVFYGDSKKLYRQRVIGSSMDGKKREWIVWAPRAKQMAGGEINVDDGKGWLACRHDDKDAKRPLVELAGDEAKSLLQRAKLYPTLWQREAHLLARDDDGVYYYIDNVREEYGGNGFRVFVGMKGAMKELAMINIARDSAGEIFATKSGQIKLTAGKGDTVSWIKGGKKTELTLVDVYADRYLIYRDLGIYTQLGAVCDDL